MRWMRSIATEYGWPDFKQVVRTEVKVDPAVLAKYDGDLPASAWLQRYFYIEGDQLMARSDTSE